MEKECNWGCTGYKGQGAREVEERDRRKETKDKVKGRLSAQLIDSSTPTGINTRKVCICMHACASVCVHVSPDDLLCQLE